MGFANKNFPSFSKTPGSFWADAIWYFPSDQGFIGYFLRDCLCLNLQGCSVVWVWTSRGAALFEFEPPGEQRENKETFLPFPGTSWFWSWVAPRLFFSFDCLWLGVVHMVYRLSKQSLRCCVDSGDALWTSNLTKHMSNFSDRFLGCLNEMRSSFHCLQPPLFSGQVAWMS